MKHIRCKGASQAIYLQGLPEMFLENVHMEDLVMESENGLICIDAKGVNIKGLDLKTTNFPALSFHNSKNVQVENLKLPESDQSLISINGSKSEQITLHGKDGSGNNYPVKLGKDVDPDILELRE